MDAVGWKFVARNGKIGKIIGSNKDLQEEKNESGETGVAAKPSSEGE